MATLKERLGRIGDLSSSELRDLIHQCAQRVEAKDAEIKLMVARISAGLDRRRDRSLRMQTTLDSSISRLELERQELRNGGRAESVKATLILFRSLESMLYDIRVRVIGAYFIVLDDAQFLYAPVTKVLRNVDDSIHADSGVDGAVLDGIAALVGLLPLPFVGMVSSLIGAFRLGNSWNEKLDAWTSTLESIKGILALEWFLDQLDGPLKNKLEGLASQREEEMGRFDLLFDQIEKMLAEGHAQLKSSTS